MDSRVTETVFTQSVQDMAEKANVFGAVLSVENGDGTLSWTGAEGNIKEDDRYFLTSVTKLLITIVILKLREKNRLQLEDKIQDYLPEPLLDGLHVLYSREHSYDITIKHLLSNTSGLPDYLSSKQENGKKGEYNLFKEGQDEAWPLEKVLKAVKVQKPLFKPGKEGKVYYANTNHRLLGAVIEEITGTGIGEVFNREIFEPLQLKNTYVYNGEPDRALVPMYMNRQQLNIPRCMASVTAEGGVVSTAADTMTILKAFFQGTFFPPERLKELEKWNFVSIMMQFYFGIGLEKLWVPRLLSPTKPIDDVLGFWGSSGAFAFYHRETDLYFTGTVNQSSGFAHNAAYKAIINIIKAHLP